MYWLRTTPAKRPVTTTLIMAKSSKIELLVTVWPHL
jgi:hypothetical protein